MACMKCKHYFSTFDPNLPRGCKLYGLRCAQFPEQVVKKESGRECLGFEIRNSAKKEQTKSQKNLNDPRYW